MSLIDRGLYLIGFIALIGQGKPLEDADLDRVTRVGRTLNFSRDFCCIAIEKVRADPEAIGGQPVFSTAEVAAAFVRDGLLAAGAAGHLAPQEQHWLRAVAERNGLDWHALVGAAARPQAPRTANADIG